MKLLLTSDGITNKSITKALFELVGKKPEETRLTFIPTAMNFSSGDKSWFADALFEIRNLNLKHLDIVDISALPKEVWLPRLESADVLFFSGGTSVHLMYCLRKSGLIDLLPGLLKTKVYAGLSAGSTVAAPDIGLSRKEAKIKHEKIFGYNSEEGLGLVDFYVQAHLNSPEFPERSEKSLSEFAKSFGKTIYALDRNSALKIIDGKVEVISEGKYLKLN